MKHGRILHLFSIFLDHPFSAPPKRWTNLPSVFDIDQCPWRTAKGGCSREAGKSFCFGLWSSPFSCSCNTPSTDRVHSTLKMGLGSSLFYSHETSLQREKHWEDTLSSVYIYAGFLHWLSMVKSWGEKESSTFIADMKNQESVRTSKFYGAVWQARFRRVKTTKLFLSCVAKKVFFYQPHWILLKLILFQYLDAHRRIPVLQHLRAALCLPATSYQ